MTRVVHHHFDYEVGFPLYMHVMSTQTAIKLPHQRAASHALFCAAADRRPPADLSVRDDTTDPHSISPTPHPAYPPSPSRRLCRPAPIMGRESGKVAAKRAMD